MSIFYSMPFKARSQVWDNFWQPKVVDETIKNAVYFTLKSLFVLEIFQFLLWTFSHVGKRLDKKTKLNFKIYDVTQWIRSHYHTEEIAHKVKAIRQLNLVSHLNITWKIFFLENHTQNVMKKLVPDPFSKNQDWAYPLINNLTFYTICLYYMSKWRAIERYWN